MATRLFMQRAMQSTLGKASTSQKAIWAFPALTLVTWILWPALDQEWMQGLGLEPDPEAGVKKVQAEKDARLAIKADLSAAPSAGKEEEEEEEEAAAEVEEEVEVEEEEAAPEEEEKEAEEEVEEVEEKEEEAAADEEEEEKEAEEEEEEDEEEEAESKIKPLYVPLIGDALALEDLWDNFTIKAVRTNEDDSFEDDEDEDEEEEGK
jgi:outer membrane biosynthesis protein TonB